ncbi:MAG: cupin domain-containing protein [Chloroflexota bacterium]|nr:MAG: cupin domain-containing protein [Chloroflexota bacterium]TMD87132.1 MAG: cupin domain-containing protein [Chloroflexota bacterium]
MAQTGAIYCTAARHLLYSAKHSHEVTPPIVGPIIENPLHGERIRFLKTVPETNGELVQYESWLAPGGGVGDPHIHPIQESRFTVLSGTASFSIHGARFELGQGQQLTIPARTAHCLWNAGTVETHLLVEFRPGMLKQEFSETTFGLARDGRHHLRGIGNTLQWAVIAAAYRRETRSLGRPLWLRLGLPALAPVGWMLGYRAHYPRYCTREANQLAS